MRVVLRSARVLAARDRAFRSLFDREADNARLATATFVQLLRDYPDNAELADRIRVCEQDGDLLTHEVINHLNQTAPLAADHADVIALASTLDDIVDYVDEVADYLRLYKIDAPMDQSITLAEVLMGATDELALAISKLPNVDEVAVHKAEVHRLENDGDRIGREAVASLFDANVDPMFVIRWKDLFERLEAAIDATEHAVNIAEGIAVKRG